MINDVVCLDLSSAWNEKQNKSWHIISVSDALIKSLNNRGCVDIRYISDLTGKSPDMVIDYLKGSIYQNPDKWKGDPFTGWETSEEYLSGNLIRKKNRALTENELYPGRFDANIKAIERVLPPAVATEDIYITLGSPWVPADIIDEFIKHLFGEAVNPYKVGYFMYEQRKEALKCRHDEITGIWEIPEKSRFTNLLLVSRTYGTFRKGALQIIEDTLNGKTVKVTDEIDCFTNESGVMRVINRVETEAAKEKQQLLIKKFREWVWKDPERKARLEKIYEERYGCVRARIYDGSFLEFPTMSPKVALYPYQKDAVARMIFSPNTLLAHDVGSGKTYEMIAAGQELRRMNLSKKNMYVVPNNITGQWKKIFMEMYPDANILVIDPNTFKPARREAVLKDVHDGDYDGIIIAYSCFDMIPLSKEYHIEDLRERLKEANERLSEMKNNPSCALRARIKRYQKELMKLHKEPDDKSAVPYFDSLGITRLFVDEAHNYKNVPVETRSTYEYGISRTGSKKCREMMEKVRYVQKSGGGVVMATGTPITNSITDAFVMQMYLQRGELEFLDLHTFDSWVGMFAESVTDFEVDVDTSSYRMVTRFSKFHNLPELTALLSSVADFHSVDVSAGIPVHDGYEDTIIERSGEFVDYLKKISQRADNVRSGRVNRKDDNMLKITSDGRKAALDMRLVNPNAGFTYNTKVARCADNVAKIYHKTAEDSSTQLVFCDSSTPKDGFNLYDELMTWLVLYGVSKDEIAFIHDADNEKKRSALFAKVRSGKVRVLIGSTPKLGLGVNIQDKLIALHHLDVPWRPADMTQREGRILRQGNTNPKVYIYRYITQGSFDAYSWQLLETKQRFINGLLSGSITARSNSDIEDTVLNYAEVKALAMGNSLVKKRVEAANELARYRALQCKAMESRLQMEAELTELPSKITKQLALIKACEKDVKYSRWWTKEHSVPLTSAEKKDEAERRKVIRERLDAALRDNVRYGEERTLMTYRGFKVILPSTMTSDKPYIYLEREGRYLVELGGKEVGNIIRIDNYIDSLSDYLNDLKRGHSVYSKRQIDLRAELAKKEDYSDQIEQYRLLVNEIDKELGVNEDE